MTQEQLKETYGDEMVMVVESRFINGFLEDGFSRFDDIYYNDEGTYCGLDWMADKYKRPMPRYLAEMDSSVRQIIPYAVIEQKDSGLIFAMRRIGGDERLVGQIGIGVGGHMQEQESIMGALSREIREETGLVVEEALWPEGYIVLNESEVDKVHVGIIYRVFTERDDLRCLETDKLEGFWATLPELRAMRSEGKLESWSELVLDCVLKGNDGGSTCQN